MQRVMDIMKKPYGSVIISAVIGLGMAAMFHKACEDGSCTVYVAPAQRDVLLRQFRYGDACYEYEAQDVACDDPSKTFHVQSRK